MKTFSSMRRTGRSRGLARLVVVTAILSVAGAAEAPPQRPGIEGIVPQLDSESMQARQAAFLELRRQHRELVEELLERASRADDRWRDSGTRELSVLLLGELASRDYGVRKAIPLLVKNVEYKAPTRAVTSTSVPGYPCAIALLTFGHAAVPEILLHLHRSPREDVSDLAIDLYGRIIVSVYSPENVEAAIAWVEISQRKAAKLGMRREENFRRLLSRLEVYRPK